VYKRQTPPNLQAPVIRPDPQSQLHWILAMEAWNQVLPAALMMLEGGLA